MPKVIDLCCFPTAQKGWLKFFPTLSQQARRQFLRCKEKTFSFCLSPDKSRFRPPPKMFLCGFLREKVS